MAVNDDHFASVGKLNRRAASTDDGWKIVKLFLGDWVNVDHVSWPPRNRRMAVCFVTPGMAARIGHAAK